MRVPGTLGENEALFVGVQQRQFSGLKHAIADLRLLRLLTYTS